MKILVIIVLLFMTACKATKFQDGTYRVESAKHFNGKSVVHFEGLNKGFIFDNDTLKRGDLVNFAQRPKNAIKIGQ